MPLKVHHVAGSVALMVLMPLAQAGFAFTKSAGVYTTDGSQADVAAAVAAAATGEVVNIPAGSFTWGAAGTYISISKPISLNGAGTAQTMINLAPSGPPWSGGVIRISAAATVKNFTINGAGSGNVSALACGTANGWRITGVHFNGVKGSGYFAYVGSYGLIKDCTINGGDGTEELIFGRGPADSWQTPDSMGTSDAVYIEDCTFAGQGYVCDANSNARFVVRFCTITGPMKIDGHGKASNTPPRGVRQMEIYGNRWTHPNAYWAAMEIRGGTGVIFDNRYDGNARAPWCFLTDYGYMAEWPSFSKTFQTPDNYPVDDQIGVGLDPKAAASDPYYLWNNVANGSDWALTWKAIPESAIALYRKQTGNANATFRMQDVIKADRDYFKGTVGETFDGSTGVGMGTRMQMAAISPTKTGVGFWVTDEGQWNSRHPGPDGQLYIWNGKAWVRRYTPFTYPYPQP